MFLSRKWGHHLEQITAGNFLTTTLFRKSELPPNFSLFRNENDALWIYSTAGSEQEASAAIREECSFAESCYAPLRGKPYSLMSFTGNTMYVYIPFVWEMASEQKLRESLNKEQWRLYLALEAEMNRQLAMEENCLMEQSLRLARGLWR